MENYENQDLHLTCFTDNALSNEDNLGRENAVEECTQNEDITKNDIEVSLKANTPVEHSLEGVEEAVSSEKEPKKKKILAESELTHEEVVGKVEERLELPSDVSFKKPKTKKEKQKKWLTTILFILFNVIAVGVVLFLEIKDSNFMGFEDIMRRIGEHYEWLLILVLAFAVHMLADTFVFFALIRKCGYGHRYALSAKVAFLGTYYDNITPWATGGQPFQMHYMAKSNIDTPTAITLPVVKHAIISAPR